MSGLLASFDNVDHLLEVIPEVPERLAPLLQYLRASEAQLVRLINAASAGAAHVAPAADEDGDLEFGLTLYWLQHPAPEHGIALQANPAFSIAMQTLQRFADPSEITLEMFSALRGIAYNTGFVAADGTLYTLGKYAQLDPQWLFAAVNYVINVIDPNSICNPFPTSPYHATIPAEKKSITIAILGDWGTGVYDADYDGQGPAVAVMNAVRNLKPDYVVHLGDVYYCGTESRHPAHEEQDNFLAQWSTGTVAKTCFTLNSNHEMYGAAKGLIDVALNNGTPFEHQGSTTYFGLAFGDWVILGFDSAYFDPSYLYMKGALGNDTNTQQQNFVSTIYGNLKGKKVLVMTHHNPMSFDGSALTPNAQAGHNLWDGMHAVLGNRYPDVWYWGHLHLGVVYKKNKTALGSTVLGRCVGHSAIPFGNARGLNPDIADYYAHTPLNVGTKQVQNGFATVTLKPDGTLTEAFYEIDAGGRCTQAWTTP